jgi:hypothetical protein
MVNHASILVGNCGRPGAGVLADIVAMEGMEGPVRRLIARIDDSA